jgi:hypothetical protein
VDLPNDSNAVFFVYLNGDMLYTERNKHLCVFSMSDLSSPIATYPLHGGCDSGIVIDNRLYLGGWKLKIFEVTTSISQPLKPVTVINTESNVYKILRVGHELLLGQDSGCF